MKKKARVKLQRVRRAWLARRSAIGIALAFGVGFAGAEDEEQNYFEGPEEAGSNWVEFGLGGFFTSGNRAQAEQNRRLADGPFGGIQDLHFQTDAGKGITLTLDGRALVDLHDYKLSLGLHKDEDHFLKFTFENFRTWSNGDGGYYPLSGDFYGAGRDAFTLDRGAFAVEGGWKFQSGPSLRAKYSHLYRDGDKGSTIWGPTHPSLMNPTAGLVPTVQEIDESRHIFELELTHRIKQTDVGLGGVYEFGDLNNARKISQYPGEGILAGERKITNREKTDYDFYSVHAFAENWLKPNLFFSTGYLFSQMDNDTTGSRIWGDDFDVAFTTNPAHGQGYTNLLSSARKQEHVVNINLMSQASQTFTITPSVRVQRQDWDANSTANSTFGNNTFGATASNADADAIDIRERLDLRYTGVTNWVFTARGEWTQGQGTQTESGGLFNAINNPGVPIDRETETTRFFQKYSLGAKWYAARRLSFDFGGYYKHNEYDYDHGVDSTPNNAGANRYPAYLTLQKFETYDGNLRVTWRPRANLTLVSRYEYQVSTVTTTPDPVSGFGGVESSELTSHILAQNVSWAPWSRLYFQVGANYVNSELTSPVTSFTDAVLAAQNNYWTLNANAGFVVDDRTDLNLGYTYYLADNFTDNTPAGVPLGSGAEEHGINTTVVRRINQNLRATLRYGYYHYTDESAGGRRDYEAHVVFTSLQYRF
jgi:hypothetical protein